MKTNLTILSILIAGTLATTAAQSGPMTVKLFSTDSTSSANGPQTTSLILSFTNEGKDSLDMYDMGNLGSVTTTRDFCSPFTLSAENEFLTMVDHRNVLTGPSSIPFGIYTKNVATVSLTANAYYSTPNPGDTVLNTEIGNIYIEDLGSSLFYDIKDTTASLIVPVNTIPTSGYVLHFFPAMNFVTTDETCYGMHDGTFHVTNPGMTSWQLQVSGPLGTTNIPVYQSDTTITMLMPGTYIVKSLFNGLLTDQQTVNIFHHAPVLPTFTPGATVEAQLTNILFTNTSADPSLTWSWDMGDGNTFATADVTHSYISAGFYTVVLTATDDAGCTGSFQDTLEITMSSMAPPPAFNDPHRIVVRNNTQTEDPTMTQRDGNTIVITQNGETNPTLIEVYTINGQHVASEKPSSTVTEINVPNGGCYIVMMTMPNGEVKTQRIVLGL